MFCMTHVMPQGADRKVYSSRESESTTAPVKQASNVIYYNNAATTDLGLPHLVDEGANEPLEVEMEERWAEDEELMMDVDMTTELQQEVYQQVC